MDSFWFSSSQILFGLFFQPISTHAQKIPQQELSSTYTSLWQLHWKPRTRRWMEPSPCSLVTVQSRGDMTVMYCNGAREHSGTNGFQEVRVVSEKGRPRELFIAG